MALLEEAPQGWRILMKALVTGAGGFIGHHLAKVLAARGFQVRCFVRYTSTGGIGLLSNLPGDVLASCEVVRGDLRDPGAVADAVRGCDAVFHLGAHISIPFSYLCPADVVSVNVGGTVNVLEAARRSGCTVVVTSTSEVYGTARQVPMTEEHPLSAQSPYAASKTAADQIALSYHRSFGMPVVVCRPFNTYGPGQSRRAVIPTVISQALESDVIELGSTDTTRDFVFVSDTAEGLAAALRPEAVGHVVHLGTGRETGVAELVEMVGGILGRKLAVRVSPERIRPAGSEVMRLVADPSRARELLGWQARIPLAEGLAATVEWMRSHPEHGAVRGYAL